MNVRPLTKRINDLSDSNKQLTGLIQRLAKLQTEQSLNSSTTSLASSSDTSQDNLRADLSAEIHESLKQQEEDFELLKQDIEDVFPANTTPSRKSAARQPTPRQSESELEAARLSSNCTRLEEDLKLARIRFRKAQLQAKHSADQAKAKDRAAYLDSLRTALSSPDPASANDTTNPASLFTPRSRKPNNNNNASATQSDILLSATSDVTLSLRRTHALLSSELSRSRFAHDTLESSNRALEDLTTQYSSLDSILATSRGLLGSLLRSQKSDTWYLETAFYLLVGTIAWLVFRRLLYGPLYWFLWLPLKLAYWVISSLAFPLLGLASKSSSSSVSVSASASTRPPLITHNSAPPHRRASSSIPPANATPLPPSYLPVGAGGAHAKQGPDAGQPAADRAAAGRSVAEAASSASAASQSAIDDMADRAAAAVKEAERIVADTASGNAAQGGGSDSMTDEQGAEQDQREQQQKEEEEKPVVRGDGTVLPKRDPTTQPVNPKKRTWEEPVRQEL